MKKFIATIPFVLLLAACDNTAGFPAESSRPAAGNVNSPIVLEEYADIECPACKAAHESTIKLVLQNYGSQIKYEFNHSPLRQIHRNALPAAKAAECAADQGKFWEFLDMAFANQSQLSSSSYEKWGEAIGISDLETFKGCFESDAKRATIMADYSEGKDRGVQGTPTLFLNGERVSGAYDALSAAIEVELSKVEARL